jgi:archaellum biogenesis ATPase FlaH
MTLETKLLSYVNDFGFPIFPVNLVVNEKGKVDKKPALTWGKYQKELPTEADVKSWCKRYAGWGMATGELSRIVVVDVDMDKLEEAEAILGVSLYSPLMVKTTSGGMHIYYKWHEELRNTVKIENSPIDFRGDGGFVVIPPSKSPKGEYVWVKEPTPTLKMLLPELPEQIRKLLTLNKTKVKITLEAGGDVFADGERNAASTVAIRKLLGELPQNLWATTGWYAFNHWCKTFCQPALDDYQIRATFDWWVRSNAKDQTSAEGRSTMEISLERIEERKLERTAPKTGYQDLDSRIRGWMPGQLYTFTGETNAGKSAAACNFAYRVWLQEKKVAYFALEPDVGVIDYLAGISLNKRWSAITDEDLKLDMPGFSVFTKDPSMNLEKLLKTIETMERQDLIIVDHIGYFTDDPKDRRSKLDKESDAIKRIVSLAKKKKTAIMIIAHPRKNKESRKKDAPLSINDISGSAAFKQDATYVLILHMQKDPNDQFGLVNTTDGFLLIAKAKTGKQGTIPIRFVADSPIMLDQHEAGNVDYDAVFEAKDPELEF